MAKYEPCAVSICYQCLCETCNRLHCPYKYRNMVEHCLHTQYDGICPRRECDYYENRRKRPVLRIKKRYTREDRIFDALSGIMERLEQLESRNTLFR